MQVRRLDESLDDADGGVELRPEAVVLLVAPGVAEGHQLAMQPGKVRLQFPVEPLQIRGKAAKLRRIDDRPRHGPLLRELCDYNTQAHRVLTRPHSL